jgi:hypothetical protein
MLKKWIWMVMSALLLFISGETYAAKHKTKSKKAKVTAVTKSVSKTTKSRKSSKRAIAKHSKKKGKKGRGKFHDDSRDATNESIAGNVHAAPMQMIAQNKEKSRISDSVHKTYFANATKEVDEGFYASSFAAQKKANAFQTIEGTASVFKSVSGWEDKKFYVLTNELPVGTIVRVTTSDLKSICAKVINVLPEVGNAIQYRLNDAAVAILGITSKTFKVSVTY